MVNVSFWCERLVSPNRSSEALYHVSAQRGSAIRTVFCLYVCTVFYLDIRTGPTLYRCTATNSRIRTHSVLNLKGSANMSGESAA